MNKFHLSFKLAMFVQSAQAVASVAATTLLFLLIGREKLGEAVIALLYLMPIGWSASRWGPLAGMSAAVAAALAFNFLFIPPYHTFVIGSLEGWLVWVIFMIVAAAIVGRIQSALSQAQASEREAIFMYELSTALAGQRTQAAVAHTLASHFQQLFQTSSVRVILHFEGQPAKLVVSKLTHVEGKSQPDRVLPIWNAWGLVGEIQLWRGYGELPPPESRLLQNFASQAGQALERARLAETEERMKARTASLN